MKKQREQESAKELWESEYLSTRYLYSHKCENAVMIMT